MLKLCMVTKVKVFFPLWYQFFIQFNFNSFKSVAVILEKGLLRPDLIKTLQEIYFIRELQKF